MTKDEQVIAARVTAKLRGDRFVLEERGPAANPFQWRYGAWDLVFNRFANIGEDDLVAARKMVAALNAQS